MDPVYLGMRQSCPNCGGEIALSQVSEQETRRRPPQPGDPTLCVHCSAVLAFTESGGLRPVPHFEVLTWSPEMRRQIADGVIKIQSLIRQRKH